jgi:hypothetical protein
VPDGGVGSICTSNVAVSFSGSTYLVSAGHCPAFTDPQPAGHPTWVGNIAVPFFNQDVLNGVSHDGLYIGNFRWFQYNLASGFDISLTEMVRQNSTTDWPEPSAAGLATGLFTLTPNVNQLLHYGYGSGMISNPSYVCFEGASPDRINVIGTNSANGRNGNRCGPVSTSNNAYASMQEIRGPFSGVCGGDSGGLVHSNGTPVGIVSYGTSANGSSSGCGTGGTGYALLSTNLAAYAGATIVGWPSANQVTLTAESGPGKCIYRHISSLGTPDWGGLSEVPSILYPSLNCAVADGNNRWRLDPINNFASGDAYLVNSNGYCMRTPNGWPQNWDVELQHSCFDASPIRIESAGNGRFYMRSMHNPAKCLGPRDPYNALDGHWFHHWDCIIHPALRIEPVG